MSKTTEKEFACICYLVLMDHHKRGFLEAHPSYMAEKTHILDMGIEEAWGMLDYQNQRFVLMHLKHWKFEIPEKIRRYELELTKYHGKNL